MPAFANSKAVALGIAFKFLDPTVSYGNQVILVKKLYREKSVKSP